MNSRSVGSAPPPFYWKVPVPEKDYMSENYRRIRQIAYQSQKKRSEPLKAAFIPGVTKNEKYAHVPSRVGEFLKTRRVSEGPPELPVQNSRRQPQRVPSSLNQPVTRRLSKSSTDLRGSKPEPRIRTQEKFPNVRQNGHPSQSQQSNSALPAMTRRRRISEESFSPNQESVYNWRFKDDIVNEFPSGASISNGPHNPTIPAKYCHRVEYLPCDGICAEENFVLEDKQPDSARSSSSCRTSRGCNTEETRILGDQMKSFELDRPMYDEGQFEERIGKEVKVSQSQTHIAPTTVQAQQLPKSRSVFSLPSQSHDGNMRRTQDSNEWFPHSTSNAKVNGGGSYDHELNSKLNSLKISEGQSHRQENLRAKTSLSNTSLKSMRQLNSNGVGASGDFRHAPGTVPKYLKQRQEEWRVQEQERKEAELNANVPRGYVLLSDEERMDHLKSFKQNYDSLINELNRIPIRIDTIRVKEHKVQLEQQLTRLEEAMKTFSRPKVWVKIDD